MKRLVGLAAALVALAVPASTSAGGGITVFAAASMKNALDDSFELFDLKVEVTAPPGANPTLDLTGQDPQRVSWRSDQLPERVEVAWRLVMLMSRADS